MLIDSKTKTDSFTYKINEKLFKEITSKIEKILSENKATEIKSDSSISDLRELKSLLDDGIITQEEFDAKKKQLLDL